MNPTPQTIILGGSHERERAETFLGGRLEIRSARGVRGADRAVIEALPPAIEGRALVVGSREGVAALAAARLNPEAEVHCFTTDAYDLHRIKEAVRRNGLEADREGGPRAVHCSIRADLPDAGGFDWVILPLSRMGDAMLAQEIILQAHRALRERGKVLVGTDNARDSWVHERVVEVFGDATLHLRGENGVAYIARKRADHVPRGRDFLREFDGRLFGRQVSLVTRPGVFSHGRVDDGTLALSEVAEPPGQRVLDIGCGSGAIGVAAALAEPRGFALLVDSGTRAVRCARENVLRNGVERSALVVLSHDFACVRGGAFDLALANPPYFGDHRITELFASAGFDALAPGGRFHLVTKSPERPLEIVRRLFGACEAVARRGYTVIGAKKRARKG